MQDHPRKKLPDQVREKIRLEHSASKRNAPISPGSSTLSSFLENATLWRWKKTRSKCFSDGRPPKRASPLLRKNKHSALCCSSTGRFITSIPNHGTFRPCGPKNENILRSFFTPRSPCPHWEWIYELWRQRDVDFVP